MEMRTVNVANRTRSLPSPLHAVYCDSFLCRLQGLMFRSSLEPGYGLILVQGHDSRIDSSIHMLFVYMDLAVIWINSSFQVVDTVLARSWKLAYAPKAPAKYILEIQPGRLGEFQVGDIIEIAHA